MPKVAYSGEMWHYWGFCRSVQEFYTYIYITDSCCFIYIAGIVVLFTLQVLLFHLHYRHCCFIYIASIVVSFTLPALSFHSEHVVTVLNMNKTKVGVKEVL